MAQLFISPTLSRDNSWRYIVTLITLFITTGLTTRLSYSSQAPDQYNQDCQDQEQDREDGSEEKYQEEKNPGLTSHTKKSCTPCFFAFSPHHVSNSEQRAQERKTKTHVQKSTKYTWSSYKPTDYRATGNGIQLPPSAQLSSKPLPPMHPMPPSAMETDIETSTAPRPSNSERSLMTRLPTEKDDCVHAPNNTPVTGCDLRGLQPYKHPLDCSREYIRLKLEKFQDPAEQKNGYSSHDDTDTDRTPTPSLKASTPPLTRLALTVRHNYRLLPSQEQTEPSEEIGESQQGSEYDQYSEQEPQ